MVSNWHMGLVDLHIVYITRINSVLHLRKLFLLCHCCLASGTLPHGPRSPTQPIVLFLIMLHEKAEVLTTILRLLYQMYTF